MCAASLHATGWRQGTYFSYVLDLPFGRLDDNDEPVSDSAQHVQWIVATQDCDLSDLAVDLAQPAVELRPVHAGSDAGQGGIRSNKFRLKKGLYTLGDDPRLHVTPALLHRLVQKGLNRELIELRGAFQEWLGLRYKRPAVPDGVQVQLAKAVADQIRPMPAEIADNVHDVLMVIELKRNRVRYSVFAAIHEETHAEAVRSWLMDALSKISSELGALERLEAVTIRRLPWNIVQDGFSVDASDLTWRKTKTS